MPDINHHFMTPPSLRIQQSYGTPAGDEVYVWDLRVAQPNVSHVAMPVVHSLEHFLATYMRQASEKVLAVAPMGCQTGFYIVVMGIGNFDEISSVLAGALERVDGASEVPVADSVHCGWAENHSLVGAQEVARWLLRRRSDWPSAASGAPGIDG